MTIVVLLVLAELHYGGKLISSQKLNTSISPSIDPEYPMGFEPSTDLEMQSVPLLPEVNSSSKIDYPRNMNSD